MTRRRGFGFPLVLIAIGLVALLANLGLAPLSWSAALSLWPLILVIIGIDLLLAHRAPLAALALDVAVVVLGLVLLVSRPYAPDWFPFASFGARDCPTPARSASVAAQRESVQRLAFHFSGGAGTFRFSGGASNLVEATSDANDLYFRSSSSGDRVVDVRLTQCEPGGFGGRNVEVRIASDVPTSLELTGGAGTFDLDLRAVKVSDIRITNGASSTTLALPRPSGDVPVRIIGGASSINIDLGGAEARVETSGGLTSLNAPGASSNAFGRNSYETPGYASARDRYTVSVTGGVSSVSVR